MTHKCDICGKEAKSEEALAQHKSAKHPEPVKKQPIKIKKSYIITTVIVALLVWGGFAMIQAGKAPGEFDELANCLTENNAKFYGAFWCPHCNSQKEMFGKSAKLLPYVECSTPDRRAQMPICATANITGYPTWVFENGTRRGGAVDPYDLAELAGCPLPE